MSLKIENKTKLESDPCVIAWDNKLFVGTEDGSIKSFDGNLTAAHSWTAHGVQLFALAVGDGKVYSSSNDGCIRVWTSQGEKMAELPVVADVSVLHIYDKQLYSGDEAGNVLIFEDNIEKGRYNMMEEVKGLAYSSPFLYTARDLDLTVTEIKPDESKCRYLTRQTMEGRAPLCVSGDKLLLMARGGNDLRLHDASVDTKFKQLHQVKVSDMIVTSLSANGDIVYTGGWDGILKCWKIAGDKLEAAGELSLGGCINGLVASTPDCVYVIVAGGGVVKIKAI